MGDAEGSRKGKPLFIKGNRRKTGDSDGSDWLTGSGDTKAEVIVIDERNAKEEAAQKRREEALRKQEEEQRKRDQENEERLQRLKKEKEERERNAKEAAERLRQKRLEEEEEKRQREHEEKERLQKAKEEEERKRREQAMEEKRRRDEEEIKAEKALAQQKEKMREEARKKAEEEKRKRIEQEEREIAARNAKEAADAEEARKKARKEEEELLRRKQEEAREEARRRAEERRRNQEENARAAEAERMKKQEEEARAAEVRRIQEENDRREAEEARRLETERQAEEERKRQRAIQEREEAHKKRLAEEEEKKRMAALEDGRRAKELAEKQKLDQARALWEEKEKERLEAQRVQRRKEEVEKFRKEQESTQPASPASGSVPMETESPPPSAKGKAPVAMMSDAMKLRVEAESMRRKNAARTIQKFFKDRAHWAGMEGRVAKAWVEVGVDRRDRQSDFEKTRKESKAPREAREGMRTLNFENSDVDDNGASLLTQKLEEESKVGMVLLGWNRIMDRGCTILAYNLRSSLTIHTLALNWNLFGDQGATALANMLRVNHALEVLDISNNKFGKLGAAELAGSLSVNRSLLELRMSGCNFGDVGAISFGAVIPDNSFLTTLDMSRCGISDIGFGSIYEAIKENYAIQELDLTSNPDIGISSLNRLNERMALRKRLEQSGYPTGIVNTNLRYEIPPEVFQKFYMLDFFIPTENRFYVDLSNNTRAVVPLETLERMDVDEHTEILVYDTLQDAKVVEMRDFLASLKESDLRKHYRVAKNLAHAVADRLGGSFEEDMLMKWKQEKMRLKGLNASNCFLIGQLKVGLLRHRSVLFKILADSLGIPCRLVRSEKAKTQRMCAEAFNTVYCDGQAYVVDTFWKVGSLYPEGSDAATAFKDLVDGGADKPFNPPRPERIGYSALIHHRAVLWWHIVIKKMMWSREDHERKAARSTGEKAIRKVAKITKKLTAASYVTAMGKYDQALHSHPQAHVRGRQGAPIASPKKVAVNSKQNQKKQLFDAAAAPKLNPGVKLSPEEQEEMLRRQVSALQWRLRAEIMERDSVYRRIDRERRMMSITGKGANIFMKGYENIFGESGMKRSLSSEPGDRLTAREKAEQKKQEKLRKKAEKAAMKAGQRAPANPHLSDAHAHYMGGQGGPSQGENSMRYRGSQRKMGDYGMPNYPAGHRGSINVTTLEAFLDDDDDSTIMGTPVIGSSPTKAYDSGYDSPGYNSSPEMTKRPKGSLAMSQLRSLGAGSKRSQSPLPSTSTPASPEPQEEPARRSPSRAKLQDSRTTSKKDLQEASRRANAAKKAESKTARRVSFGDLTEYSDSGESRGRSKSPRRKDKKEKKSKSQSPERSASPSSRSGAETSEAETTDFESDSSNDDIPKMGDKCSECGASKKRLWRCSGCKTQWYCDRQCQRKHWETHSAVCASMAEDYKKAKATRQAKRRKAAEKKSKKKKK